MSESKFIMAQKLFRVQKTLMDVSIQDFSLDFLIPLIFKECSKENLTFWFNFYEHEVVLNLRDIIHENYELNIRQYYETIEDIDSIKLQVLINAFNLTGKRIILEDNENSSALQEEETQDASLISGDKVTPGPIREAIKKIRAKGVDVNKKSIKAHVRWGQLHTDDRIECTNYLENMEASQ